MIRVCRSAERFESFSGVSQRRPCMIRAVANKDSARCFLHSCQVVVLLLFFFHECWAFSEIFCHSIDEHWMTFSLPWKHAWKMGFMEPDPKWHINEFTKSWPWELILLSEENVRMSALLGSEIMGGLLGNIFPCLVTIKNKGIQIMTPRRLLIAVASCSSGSL